MGYDNPLFPLFFHPYISIQSENIDDSPLVCSPLVDARLSMLLSDAEFEILILKVKALCQSCSWDCQFVCIKLFLMRKLFGKTIHDNGCWLGLANTQHLDCHSVGSWLTLWPWFWYKKDQMRATLYVAKICTRWLLIAQCWDGQECCLLPVSLQ